MYHSIATWNSTISYIIIFLSIFLITKLIFKINYNYRKILIISNILGAVCYGIFTLWLIYIPALIVIDISGTMILIILEEFFMFMFITVGLTFTIYAIGRTIYTKTRS